jgi:hypothetical protein
MVHMCGSGAALMETTSLSHCSPIVYSVLTLYFCWALSVNEDFSLLKRTDSMDSVQPLADAAVAVNDWQGTPARHDG